MNSHEIGAPDSLSLVSTGASYFYGTPDDLSIVVFPRDARKAKCRSRRQRARRKKNESLRGTRGETGSWSRPSFDRFRKLLRSVRPFPYFVLLTVGRTIFDGRIFKSWLDRFCSWLEMKFKASLIWKLEFHLSGGPHVSMLLSTHVAEEALAKRWSLIVGAASMVTIEPVRSFDRMIRYMIKKLDDPQHQVPSDFKHVGRFWGHRGPLAQPVELFKIDTSEDPEMRPVAVRVARLLRRIVTARRRALGIRPMQRDQGGVGRYYWHGGGQAVADALRRYAAWLAVE